MVAGYSEYVTVMVPESNLAVYKDPDVKQTPKLCIVGTDLKTLQDRAQKVVKRPTSLKSCPTVSFQIQSPEFKDRVKIIYQYSNGSVTTVPLSRWTDKRA